MGNFKTKKIASWMLYMGLGVFVLLGCENAFSAYNSHINVTVKVNLINLPQGWSAYQVNSDRSTTKMHGSQWVKKFALPISGNYGINISNAQKSWVVFVLDQNGKKYKRKGFFQYGAILRDSSSRCVIDVGRLYKNAGAVWFKGYSKTPDDNSNRSVSGIGACSSFYYWGNVTLEYYFIIK